MNLTIKSHWKLAYRSVGKAVKVTTVILLTIAKGQIYRITELKKRIIKQREERRIIKLLASIPAKRIKVRG